MTPLEQIREEVDYSRPTSNIPKDYEERVSHFYTQEKRESGLPPKNTLSNEDFIKALETSIFN